MGGKGSCLSTSREKLPADPDRTTYFLEDAGMMKLRKGFTLIELLIVIVIIGILAAIAIPKFSKTREKAYFKAMMSDLRNLEAQQEIYYSIPTNGYSYAATVGAMTDYAPSQGVTVAMAASGNTGWSATSLHAALDAATQWCAIFTGTAAAVAPAATPGIVTCTGE
jgi:prepilin-type N-terminal cleavage/methylation domain-containing protein